MSTPETSASTSPRPREEDNCCDLVMKGGVTSGVVYPRAIAKIAATYRLKGIGGTSAGAIASAAAAAAEFARVRKVPGNPFDELEKLPEFLSKKNASGQTNLFTFFQPQPGTKRLFRVFASGLNSTKGSAALRVALAAIRHYWISFLTGALPGGLLVGLALGQPASALVVMSVIIGFIVALAGGIGAVVFALVREFGQAVPRNHYGLCSGFTGCVPVTEEGGPPVALTPWLTDYLNRVAGLDANATPLTFGQLWNPTLPAGDKPKPEDSEIRLEMMTTCLTWGRPFRLPFSDEEDLRENIFYFKEDEFRKLFPDKVVTWLCKNGRDSTLPEAWRKQGFRPMPEPWNLPVVVATRMSLSFPVLLSAVPLYAYDKKDDHAAAPPRRCWFSDGGICSNFPMHFFDSPLPRWPTLGFNLVPDDAVPEPAKAGEDKFRRGWMPENNNEFLPELRNEFAHEDGLGGFARFVGSIITTMQNWSDNTVGRMPGYRDRIAHVPLRPIEGGLNLNMPDDLILELGRRGQETGAQFVERFALGQHAVMDWENHRWIRLRSALASLEKTILRLEKSCAHPPSAGPEYEVWLHETDLEQAPSYEFRNDKQRLLALTTLHELREIAVRLKNAATPLEKDAPRPRPELRPRPRI